MYPMTNGMFMLLFESPLISETTEVQAKETKNELKHNSQEDVKNETT